VSFNHSSWNKERVEAGASNNGLERSPKTSFPTINAASMTGKFEANG